ncbi:phosphotransferase [Parastagonospora nodorum]|nr:phosphotransferase [Parastagonospora nodorum]
MQLCFPWRRWSSRSSGSALTKTVEDDECETIQVNQTKSDPDIREIYGFSEATERIKKEFELSDDDVRRIVGGFVEQMNKGLWKSGEAIEQLPSFITQLPTGREMGTYLAVDMGGTNIRVCAVTFNGDGTYSMAQHKETIPLTLMTSQDRNEPFDWVARVVQGFVKANDLGANTPDPGLTQRQSKSAFSLGFTFSHAVQQTSINSGTLIRWSKGFDIDGVVGLDVCACLQDAFNKLDLHITVTALTNDTVGTLLAQAYVAPASTKTVLGAVFGTGTNGAYVERTSKITKQPALATHPEATMIVNTEWGNFDQGLKFLTMTTYDCAIDKASVNPGFEMFEKQISAMYLGEILRMAILSLSQDQSLNFFAKLAIPKNSSLYVPWSLDTSILSHLESDTSPELSMSRQALGIWLGVAQVSFDIASAIKSIAHAIVRRSARLSAVALAAVLVQTGCLADILSSEDRFCIGVDGSLIEHYPGFVVEIRKALRSIEHVGELGESRVDITIAKDGSGVGAALAAHMASNMGG